jgi:hypothetical protein
VEVFRNVNGTQVAYKRKKKAISDGAQQTAKVLIHCYSKFLRDRKETVSGEWDTPDLPGLRINSPKMANLRKNITPRTIRNHIRELKELGVITSYVFHGTNANYELWISEEILFGGTEMHSLEKAAAGTSSFTFDAVTGTNFPVIQGKNFKDTNTITTCNVENPSTWQHNTTSTPKWKLINGNPDSPGNDQAGHGNEKMGAADPKNVDNYVEKSQNRWHTAKSEAADYEKLHPYFKKSVSEFWKFVARTLYSDRQWSESEVLRAKDEISRIYAEIILLRPNEKQFRDWQEELYNSVMVAEKYYNKHPEHFPGIPFTAGSTLGYFDRDNTKGFNVARSWRLKNRAEYREEYGKRLIKTAVMHLEKHQRGCAPKILQCRSFSDVVLYYDAKMKKFGTNVHAEFRKRIKIS